MNIAIVLLALMTIVAGRLDEKLSSFLYDDEWEREVTFWGKIACRAGRRRTLSLLEMSNSQPSKRLNDFFDQLLSDVHSKCETTLRTMAHRNIIDRNNNSYGSVIVDSKSEKIPEKVPIVIDNSENFDNFDSFDSFDSFEAIDRSHETHLFPRRDVVVLFVSSDDSFKVLMNGKVFKKWYNGRPFVVFMMTKSRVTASVSEELTDRIVELLKGLWHVNRVLEVFFAVPFSPIGHVLWFYDPYALDPRNGKRGRILACHVTRVHQINRFMNLHGYKLNIGMFESHPSAIKYTPSLSYELPFAEKSQGFVGIDGLTMSTIANHMNFTFDIVPPTDGHEFGYVHNNGTFFGTIGDAAYHKIDIGFNSMYWKIYTQVGSYVKAIDFTTPIDFDRLCVIVPRASRIPRWLRTFYYFHPAIWIFLVITHVIVALAWYTVRVLRFLQPNEINTEQTSYRSLLLATFYLFIGAPIAVNPRDIEKIILTALLLFGITMMGTFTGTLYHSFTNVMYYREIGNLRELDNVGIPIGTASPNLRDVFGLNETADDPIEMKSLREKLRIVGTYETGVSTMEKTAYRRDVASLSREHSFAVSRHRYVDETGASLLHLVAECPRAYYLSYVVPKDSLYLKRVNTLISRLLQAGLPPLWNSLTTERLIHVQSAIGQRAVDSRNRSPFNLRDLQTAFFLLFIGHALAVFILIGEIIYEKRHGN